MQNIPRIIGQYDRHREGPLLVVTAGVHGNEPAGIYALERIFENLYKDAPMLHGKIIGLSGNRQGLKKGVRYIDEDLNRIWTLANLATQKADSSEKKEMFHILRILQQNLTARYPRHYFIDCHTTSSESAPYLSAQDQNENLSWARQFPLHIVRGFSDLIQGGLDAYETRMGMTGFVCEAGQHQSKASIENLEGMIWLALHQVCGLPFEDLEHFPKAVHNIEKKRTSRKIFEILYCHHITPADHFKMKPGYQNFQKIEKDEHLASQNGKPIYSRWDAYLFMPLYQQQGNEGFFIIQETSA